MLQNEPSLAIVGVHTAENGPSKVRQVMNTIRRNIGETSAKLDPEMGLPGQAIEEESQGAATVAAGA